MYIYTFISTYMVMYISCMFIFGRGLSLKGLLWSSKPLLYNVNYRSICLMLLEKQFDEV